ncbi:DUF262 domain-containing protein [Maribellus mangrovi]|uniref:DUF262 domain-containing protein n=1 Tax=Maribellus mangrovi TaxID=3133146 RepID=UPI0030EBFF06
MQAELELRTIFDLLGHHFYIPHYQRGYRWTSEQVTQLLDDVWDFAEKDPAKGEFYCIQPIVVKPKKWEENGNSIDGFEVIDGQQRLTTSYLIIKYIKDYLLKVDSLVEDYGKELFTLRYETRTDSESYLADISADDYKKNIDYFHIYSAYETIKNWFAESGKVDTRTKKHKLLNIFLGEKTDNGSVQVIWYQPEHRSDTNGEELKKSRELFTRLNMGKIPLTNAELIKALFLSDYSFNNVPEKEASRRKLEICQTWDIVEQQIADESFWSFITNAKQKDYPTKIELLFDFMAKKEEHQRDPLHTFLYFLNLSKNEHLDLWYVWLKIEKYYQTLVEWQKDRNLYHKVGFLIAVGKNARVLIEKSEEYLKDEFTAYLDGIIKNEVLDCTFDDILNLRYNKKSQYAKLETVLLFFNVETIRNNSHISEFYPFRFHKNVENWSLEHIHAQNSDFLDQTKKDQWKKWIDCHLPLLKELLEIDTKNQELGELINKLQVFRNKTVGDTWSEFEQLASVAFSYFNKGDENGDYSIHSISNLALLGQADNSALNNSVFEVKRRKIIEMDTDGNYIPVCTKRVFLKYFEKQSINQQFYFWGATEQKNYVSALKSVLDQFLKQESSENGNESSSIA